MKLDQEELVMFDVLLNNISCKDNTEQMIENPIACMAAIVRLLCMKQQNVHFSVCVKIFKIVKFV